MKLLLSDGIKGSNNDEDPEMQQRRAAGSMAIKKMRQAASSKEKRTPEGRVALLKQALRSAKTFDPPMGFHKR